MPDFWSREFSEIDYGSHLPPEIQRTSLFYESCDRKEHFDLERAEAYCAAIPERFGFSARSAETLHWSVCWDPNYLSGSYVAEARLSSSPKELRIALKEWEGRIYLASPGSPGDAHDGGWQDLSPLAVSS